jgi:predicted nucleic acid-binding protein
VILVDTIVLNNFAYIERPDLLQLVLADAATTPQVMTSRHYAQRQGITVSATLGVLAALVAKGHLITVEADAFLQEMVSHGYRSPVRSLAKLSL